MGIDYTGCDVIFRSFNYVKNKTNLLTLGRQEINIQSYLVDQFLEINNFSNLKGKYTWGFCEQFFIELGFKNVDSLDNSSYEGATIIYNMNNPVPSHFKKYDYILDVGTIEYLYNLSQVCENIINLLNIDGVYVSITPKNVLSGQGIYQFTPEFYLSFFSKRYGMEVQALYLANVGNGFNDWIDVINSKNDGVEYDYIIAIIKKISDERDSLLTTVPDHYIYENIGNKN
jgi:hypothetical protein